MASHEKETSELRLNNDGLKQHVQKLESTLRESEGLSQSSTATFEDTIKELQARELSLKSQLQEMAEAVEALATSSAKEKKDLQSSTASLAHQQRKASQDLELALKDAEMRRVQMEELKVQLEARATEQVRLLNPYTSFLLRSKSRVKPCIIPSIRYDWKQSMLRSSQT